MGRFFTAIGYLFVLAASAGGCLIALAYAEVGDAWVARNVFDAEYGFCGDGFALPQLATALASFLAAVTASARAIRRGRGGPWWLLGLPVVLLASWVALAVVGECGMGADDG